MITDPELIEKTSMEIIAEELRGQSITLPTETEDIVKRVIHCTADFSYAETLAFSEKAVPNALAALSGGCGIVTDTNMAKAGINKTALTKLGGEVYCFMSDGDVAEEAKKRGITRAEVSMEKSIAICKARPVIYVVGNAPTALIKLSGLIREEKISPCLVVGVPVGFVNILEAKDEIMGCGVEYIVSRGRKGGSNVAAAILNALMYRCLGR